MRLALIVVGGMMVVPLVLRGIQWDAQRREPRRLDGILAGYLIGFLLGVAAGRWF